MSQQGPSPNRLKTIKAKESKDILILSCFKKSLRSDSREHA